MCCEGIGCEGMGWDGMVKHLMRRDEMGKKEWNSMGRDGMG